MNRKNYLTFFLFLFVFFNPINSVAESKNFKSWFVGLKSRLRTKKISKVTIDKYLPTNIKLIPKVIELDRNQPEYKLSFNKYYKLCAGPKVKRDAIKLLKIHRNKLLEIEGKYKVGRQYIVALWAIESRFGRNLGKYPVINSLVTLAYDGRRPNFFEQELGILLKLIDEGKIKNKNVIKGSWAGALGNFQFMPSSYARYGVDHNGNGQIDLWNELDDAFASAANYLASHGWQYKEPCMQKVTIAKNFNLNAQISDKKRIRVAEWQKAWLKPNKGREVLKIQFNWTLNRIRS
jgi:membrane-bound lytic murein transglycosylase B